MSNPEPFDYEAWKAETLARSRQHLKSLPPHTGRKIDCTGTNPTPPFRDRLPDEPIWDYFGARTNWGVAFIRADVRRRDILRHTGVEPTVLNPSAGVWQVDWVLQLRAKYWSLLRWHMLEAGRHNQGEPPRHAVR